MSSRYIAGHFSFQDQIGMDVSCAAKECAGSLGNRMCMSFSSMLASEESIAVGSGVGWGGEEA